MWQNLISSKTIPQQITAYKICNVSKFCQTVSFILFIIVVIVIVIVVLCQNWCCYHRQFVCLSFFLFVSPVVCTLFLEFPTRQAFDFVCKHNSNCYLWKYFDRLKGEIKLFFFALKEREKAIFLESCSHCSSVRH